MLEQLFANYSQAHLKELYDLVGVPQSTIHHPEGDAYIHTILVVNAMEDILEREDIRPDSGSGKILLYAALTHDFGKVNTTQVHEDGRITAYGHAEAGVPLAHAFLTRIGVQEAIIDHVLPLVAEHMAWIGYFTPEVTRNAVRRLARRLHPTTIEAWALVVEADISGRPPLPGGLPEKAANMLYLAREMGLNGGYRENL